ncbi:MAG: DUF309 domain-containing protein [Candidatus Acidiferrales bacterium]|jgi:predicted metal-dependent hydrolase
MKENERFERGVAHFNAGEFFEAHEVWEELWLRAPEPEKAFLQGMIQIAAAFHHYGRGNSSGTRSLLAAGIAKIGGAPDSYRGIEMEEFREEAQRWVGMLGAGKDSGAKKLPQIRRAAWPVVEAAGKRKRGG